MKILVISNMYPTNKTKWTGTFVEQQVLSLRLAQNLNVELFVISGSVMGGNFLNYFTGYFRLLKILYLSKHTFDVVHSHHYFMTLLYKFSLKTIPLVYTMHENNFFVTNSFIQTLLKWCANHSSARIVVWERMLKLFTPSNTYFLPSGVNTDIFNVVDQAISRNKLNLKSGKNYLFFPAPRQRVEKNALFLEHFITHNPGFVEEHNIDVIWGGNIRYEDMPTYMNAVDILVSFSDYESDGMTYKEAMACNLPVITFEAGNSGLYFNDQRAGTIIPKDEERLKKDILYWLQHASQGRDKLLEIQMDTKSVASKLVNIYKNSISSSL